MSKYIYIKADISKIYVVDNKNFTARIYQSPVKRFLNHKEGLEIQLEKDISFNEAFNDLSRKKVNIVQVDVETGAFVKAFSRDELLKLVLLHE